VKEADMEPLEIRVSGLGGQGVILAGYIIGKAASIYDGKEATMAQAYGPEARGSACSSQVIISGATIHYPYVTEPGVLVCMSQEAQDKFAKEVKPGGIVLLDETLVKEGKFPEGVTVYKVPATAIAEELGRKIVANIVMLGFFAACTGVVDKEAMRQAVAGSVPAAALELNMTAFDRGYEHGLTQVKPQ